MAVEDDNEGRQVGALDGEVEGVGATDGAPMKIVHIIQIIRYASRKKMSYVRYTLILHYCITYL